MSYDAAGNLIFDNSDGIGGTRTYDAENRMKQAWANNQWQTYTYDGDGRRVKRSVNGTETWQVYGVGGELLAEYAANTAASSPQKEYGYRNGQLLVTAEPSANIHWLVADQLGTPRMIADLSGSLSDLSRHDYLPFGEELFAGTGGRTTAQGYTGDSVQQKFTGQQRDNETGLDYFNARYFASTQGRFTSIDPSRKSVVSNNPQSWNRYTYALNNPLAYVDDNGKWPTWIHELIIDRALPRLSGAQRQEIKNGSWSVDDPARGGQLTSHANEHGETIPGQSQDDAAQKADQFVNTNVDNAKWNYEHHGLNSSLYDFGRAFHTVSDMTSPAHEGYQYWYVSGYRSHRNRESDIDSYRMGLAVGATLSLYKYTNGAAELQQATGYTPGGRNDPTVQAIERKFALPGSDVNAEDEALYEYRNGLTEGLKFDWGRQRGFRHP